MVATLSLAAPLLYVDFLKLLVRLGANALNYDAATFGNLLKTIGCPIFVLGHASMCLKKPALELPDVCYMTACSVLSSAFAGAYMKTPLPESVFVSGVLFFGAYLPLRWRLLASKASPLIPTIAVGAAPILTLVGLTQMAIKYGLIKKVPEGPVSMPQMATLAGTLLGIANCIKLLQMIQQKAPRDNVFRGQVLKVVASITCFSGNTLGLGWHKSEAPSGSIMRIAAALVVRDSLQMGVGASSKASKDRKESLEVLHRDQSSSTVAPSSAATPTQTTPVGGPSPPPFTLEGEMWSVPDCILGDDCVPDLELENKKPLL